MRMKKDPTNLILFFAGVLIGIATAVAQSNHVFDGRLWIAYCLYGAALVLIFWAVVHYFARDSQEASPTAPSASPRQYQSNEQRVEANPHIYISHELLRQPPPVPPVPPQTRKESNQPNIQVGGPRVARLRFIHHISSGLLSFAEDQEGKQRGLLLCFRNESIWQKTINSARNARAQLQYFIDDQEIGIGFRSGWLESPFDLTDLIAGGDSKCVVLIIEADGKFSIASKIRETSGHGDRINDKFTDLDQLPNVIVVRLLDGDDQLLIPPVYLRLTGDGTLTSYGIVQG
jgi:hypothetical protein